MITKKYNLVNNITGWAVFVIALVTYWLTLEPTASYWDCGEFLIQADKLEVGHPPGNPIFMLTARFFANFAPDSAHISVMVNAMSGLLSALTILLLFWTITHLVRRLIVKDNDDREISLTKYLVIMGAGVVGALAYCWSDTFWFSAVEAEVYAFSSFCTALVFWLILKWENRADLPHSDRYLILIAYVVGVSIAVHLLNLLCIPAIVLVFAYRKWRDMNLVKSLLALLLSFGIIVLVLFGLVPGFIKMAQRFELLFVNGFGMSFNSGALCYAIVAAGIFIWTLYELWTQRNLFMMKLSVFLSVLISGMFFIGSGWWFGWILLALLVAWLVSPYCRPFPTRVLSVIMWSIAVIFVGYSSYALILIRSSADTPMNQNSPDNVFDLASYLNREQYGENPLLYGQTLYSSAQKKQVAVYSDTVTYREDGSPVILNVPEYQQIVEKGKPMYAKGVKGAEPHSEYGFLNEGEIASNASKAMRDGDYYVKTDYKPEVKMNPELNMLFPRIYSRLHRDAYRNWVNLDTTSGSLKELYAIDRVSGEKVPELDFNGEPFINPVSGTINYPQKLAYKPSFSQNLEYFFNYQLVHMYMRYFMWNFAGRQNDVLNQSGEVDAGNWISGIPFIDNARLGDQSLLPADLGRNNQGHNVYYMLPLLLGIIGLLWQAFAGKRGIEQFWVVFFLFFMTGIAIVLYLNQTPNQPRERDYAFAGSFYAYAVWIGMGVAGLWSLLRSIISPRVKPESTEAFGKAEAATPQTELPEQSDNLTEEPERLRPASLYAAIAACLIGLVIPIQMVSQTWDDHDRSGRYAARDFGINYLESLEPNAIVFCNGDNDTFPLWYAQEVEGVRPDVKIINLSYLASDWYANQMRKESYTAKPVSFTAKPEDIAYGRADVTLPGRDRAPADLLTSLKMIYSGQSFDKSVGYSKFPSAVVTIPVDKKAVIARGLVAPQDSDQIVNEIVIDLAGAPAVAGKGYVSLGELLMLDIIATNAAEGWPRPIYWCSTVGGEYHLGLSDYMRAVGMTHQIVPTRQSDLPSRNDRGYDVVTKKYRWGGADKATADKRPYFDETARRMLTSTRNSMLDVSTEFIYQGDLKRAAGDEKGAQADYKKAVEVAALVESKLSEATAPYGVTVGLTLAETYSSAADRLNSRELKKKAADIAWGQLQKQFEYVVYNREINRTLGNVSMTLESRLMPYQYWRYVEIYRDNGGDMKKLTDMLGKQGFTLEDLKRNYDAMYRGSSSDSSGYSADDLVKELAAAAEIVNRLTGLSASEYAAAPEEDRYLDSIYYTAYEQYVAAGVTKEQLMADPQIKKVDMERSKRLSEEYSRLHGAK